MFLTKTNDYEELCDTNKNVTKMGVIIRGFTAIGFFKWKTPLTLEGHKIYKSKRNWMIQRLNAKREATNYI